MITTLTIKFDTETKQIKVEGLLDDTLLMLGLLEMAKLTIIERRSKTSNVIDTKPNPHTSGESHSG